MKKLNLMSILIFTAAITLSGVAVAQQQPAQPQPAEDVSDTELEQFADARASIIKIQQTYSARLETATDPEQASELQQEANVKMVGAVEDAGLDVESFNSIAMAVQNDPSLQEKLGEVSNP